jgi:uncharacterized membrane protein
METQTFDMYSFLGIQFLAIAKRFGNSFQYDTLCKVSIDNETYYFFVNNDEETITISK